MRGLKTVLKGGEVGVGEGVESHSVSFSVLIFVSTLSNEIESWIFLIRSQCICEHVGHTMFRNRTITVHGSTPIRGISCPHSKYTVQPVSDGAAPTTCRIISPVQANYSSPTWLHLHPYIHPASRQQKHGFPIKRSTSRMISICPPPCGYARNEAVTASSASHQPW